MFVPVHDINPLKRLPFQWVTVALIALNILCYLVLSTDFFAPINEYVAEFALIPSEILGHETSLSNEIFQLHDPLPMPEEVTVLSYMFVHLSFIHLAGNMTFLWVFGDNVEDAMGHVRFLLFYLLCGVVAGLTHIALDPDSGVPVIGASGAVGGIIGAYLMLHPNVKVWVLALYRIPLRITAAMAIGFWIAVQIYNILFSEIESVAWGAHLGGFVAGIVLIVIMRQPGVPLFDKTAGEV